MIVNYKENGWEITTQRAHGVLAAQLASHWRKADRDKRWVETLVAIADHDDAQVELQRDDLLTATGGPVNFKMREFKLEHGQRTMEFSISKSRYIALLCSMHLTFIAGEPKEWDKKMKQFFADQKQCRALWLKELKLTNAEAQYNYDLLEWCDALSLLICQHDNQPEARAVEISRGPDDKPYQLIQTSIGELTVDPWPFEKRQFTVFYENRLINKLAFKDCFEFKQCFEEAQVNETSWKLVKKA